ncbi:MAG: helix-turn-helix domain-containing protein [Pseudobdellovibrionaceae bacterium]|jgi:transcriptional regulator with XRE-family HTH domain
MINLSEFLKNKREASGLSQKDVAKKLGYTSPQFISNWERGISNPPLPKVKRLADLYKIPHDEIYNVMLNYTIQVATEDLKAQFYGRKRKSH